MDQDIITNNFEIANLKKIVVTNIQLVKLILLIGGLIQTFYLISIGFQIYNPLATDITIYKKIEPYLLLVFIFLYFSSWITYLGGQRFMKSYVNDLNISSLIESNLYFKKALIITLISNILSVVNIILKTIFS